MASKSGEEYHEYHELLHKLNALPGDRALDFEHAPAALYTARWVKRALYGHASGIGQVGLDTLDKAQAVSEGLDNTLGLMMSRAAERFDRDIVDKVVVVAYGSYGRFEFSLGSDFDAYLIMPEGDSREHLNVLTFLQQVTNDAFGQGVSLVPHHAEHEWDGSLPCQQISSSFVDARFVKANAVNYGWEAWTSWRKSVFLEIKLNIDRYCRGQYLAFRSRHASRRHNEPIFDTEDIKTGPGGLRDFHFIRWLGLGYVISDIGDSLVAPRLPVLPPALARKALARRGLLDEKEWDLAQNAYYFLLGVRIVLGEMRRKSVVFKDVDVPKIVASLAGPQYVNVGISETTFIEEYREARRTLCELSNELSRRLEVHYNW